ncbi:helix-turn-helix domain-containing protein [Chelatococcus sp. GCM10030263]|uniref:IclR family transcriptional regulator domain-containing protein n=1 Tax=Chelatococcus sp. GCM10030263 TaxID=3273387 RepID=UPI0036097825
MRRALEVLRTVNRLRIASVTDIYAATGLPKPTIVRMLETLITDGYVARDNMFGGYRVTCRVHELTKGYGGISMVIEASRAPAIELTRRMKWPIGIGVLEGDAISIQFWTGAISPWAHTNTVLGLRPTLLSSAMGRSYVAFCPEEEREKLFASMRETVEEFTAQKENEFRHLLARVRTDGFALRDPRTEPKQMTTIAVPLMFEDKVLAAMSVSFYKSAVPLQNIAPQIVAPMKETRGKIEENLSLLMRDARSSALTEVDTTHGLAPLTPG